MQFIAKTLRGFFTSSGITEVYLRSRLSFLSLELECWFRITFAGKKHSAKKPPRKLRSWILILVNLRYKTSYFYLFCCWICQKNMALLLGLDKLWVAITDFLVLQIFSDYVFCFRQLLPHGSSVVSHWSTEALSNVVSQIGLAVAAWPLRWRVFFPFLWFCSYRRNYLLSSFCGLCWKRIGSEYGFEIQSSVSIGYVSTWYNIVIDVSVNKKMKTKVFYSETWIFPPSKWASFNQHIFIFL